MPKHRPEEGAGHVCQRGESEELANFYCLENKLRVNIQLHESVKGVVECLKVVTAEKVCI